MPPRPRVRALHRRLAATPSSHGSSADPRRRRRNPHLVSRIGSWSSPGSSGAGSSRATGAQYGPARRRPRAERHAGGDEPPRAQAIATVREEEPRGNQSGRSRQADIRNAGDHRDRGHQCRLAPRVAARRRNLGTGECRTASSKGATRRRPAERAQARRAFASASRHPKGPRPPRAHAADARAARRCGRRVEKPSRHSLCVAPPEAAARRSPAAGRGGHRAKARRLSLGE